MLFNQMYKTGIMKNTIKKIALSISILSFATLASAQVYKTSTGTVKFHSHTAVEDIDATNSTVAAALSVAGAVEFSLSINSFQFKKALMQKHFQENYMESSKFSKSTF